MLHSAPLCINMLTNTVAWHHQEVTWTSSTNTRDSVYLSPTGEARPRLNQLCKMKRAARIIETMRVITRRPWSVATVKVHPYMAHGYQGQGYIPWPSQMSKVIQGLSWWDDCWGELCDFKCPIKFEGYLCALMSDGFRQLALGRSTPIPV